MLEVSEGVEVKRPWNVWREPVRVRVVHETRGDGQATVEVTITGSSGTYSVKGVDLKACAYYAVAGYRDLIHLARDRLAFPRSWEVGNRYQIGTLAFSVRGAQEHLPCFACKYGVSVRRRHRNCPHAEPKK